MDGSKIDTAHRPYDADLSDVIAVIRENDPDFEQSTLPLESAQASSMFNGGGEVPAPPRPHHHSGGSNRHDAYIKIIEQPAQKALRFRYECEGRSAGSIPGASSTQENKTYPEIKIVGYSGRAVAVVSCVIKDPPYAVHPHKLVGKGCNRGVCTVEIAPNTPSIQFQNLGIQCVKKREIEQSLQLREQIRVDPFRQHYHHRNQPTSIDLNAVRLCFQVFLEGDGPRKFTVPLKPVVSDIIYDKKAMSDLTIIKLSDCVSHVDGGRKDMILLCEKVAKEDVEVHFFELRDGQRVWEAKADFQPTQVYKQYAIWFRTPRYHTVDVAEPVKVFIQLYRPSDQLKSEPLPFELLPLSTAISDRDMRRKRPKYERDQIINQLSEPDKLAIQRAMNTLTEPIKTEPRDTTSPYGGYIIAGLTPNYITSPAPSPHFDYAPIQSPENYNYMIYRNQPVNPNAFNPMTQIKTDEPGCSLWNIPMNIQSIQPMATDILDLDNNQISSGVLTSTLNSMAIPSQLPEINLNDDNLETSADSLTNLVNKELAVHLGSNNLN